MIDTSRLHPIPHTLLALFPYILPQLSFHILHPSSASAARMPFRASSAAP